MNRYLERRLPGKSWKAPETANWPLLECIISVVCDRVGDYIGAVRCMRWYCCTVHALVQQYQPGCAV